MDSDPVKQQRRKEKSILRNSTLQSGHQETAWNMSPVARLKCSESPGEFESQSPGFYTVVPIGILIATVSRTGRWLWALLCS